MIDTLAFTAPVVPRTRANLGALASLGRCRCPLPA